MRYQKHPKKQRNDDTTMVLNGVSHLRANKSRTNRTKILFPIGSNSTFVKFIRRESSRHDDSLWNDRETIVHSHRNQEIWHVLTETSKTTSIEPFLEFLFAPAFSNTSILDVTQLSKDKTMEK